MELTEDERLRHLYCGGKTGVGKSVFLEGLAFDDIRADRGFAFIDPHGQSVDRIADAVPHERYRDLIYLKPGSAPVAFNPLAGNSSPTLKASNILLALKGIWWAHAEYPLTEWLLLYSLIVLAEREGSTLLDLLPLLHSEDFQASVIATIKDDEALRFWTDYWPSLDKKDRAAATRSVDNKLGQFLAFPEIRWILSSPPRIDLTTTLDAGQILLLNLSKASIGSTAAKLLGSLFVSSLYTAAFARKNTTLFNLYIDECRNFAPSMYEDIMAESRKTGLALTISSQSMTQLPKETQDAILSICGSLALFRLGTNDAELLAPELNSDHRIFNPTELSTLDRHTIWLKREHTGSVSKYPLDLPLPPAEDRMHENLRSSHLRYGAV